MRKLNPEFRLPTVVSVIALAVATPVAAQNAAEVEVRTGGVAGTDPFLVGGDDTDAAAVSFEVLPELRWEGETSVIRLSGQLRYEEWLSRYGSDISGKASLYAEQEASETLTLFGDVSYQTRERANPELLGSSLSSDDLGIPDDFDVPADPALDLASQRRQSATASLGAEKQVSETGSFRAELSTSANWFETNGLDYRTTRLDTAFSQKVGPRVAMIIGLSGTLSDYSGQTLGDGKFGNAMLGFDIQLSETSSLMTSGGVGVVSVDNGLDANETKTFFLANAKLCEKNSKSTICVSGSRESRPTTIGGASTVTSARLGWNVVLGEFENLSVNASYTDTKASLAVFDVIGSQRSKYATASVRYSRSLAGDLGFYISPSAAKLFDDAFDRDSNFQLLIGLSYRFGS